MPTYAPKGYSIKPPKKKADYALAPIAGMGQPAQSGTYYPPGTSPQQAPTHFNSGGLWDTSSSDFTKDAEWLPYLIQGNLGGAASQGLSDLYGSMGDYTNSRLGAITSLGAGAQQGLVDTYRNRAMAGAGDRGRQTAAMLRAQGIQGADAAAGLDAQNQAANASNAYAAQVYDPAAQAQRYAQQMQLSSPEAAFPLLQMIMALDQAANQKAGANNALHAQSASSGLGGILGSVLGMATGGGFGDLASIFGNFGQQNPAVGQAASLATRGAGYGYG